MSQFYRMFSNRNASFDANGLADILDASYTQKSNKTEFLTKKGFAPSTLTYGNGECPRYWYMAFNGVEFVKSYDPYSVDNMQSGTDAHRRMQQNFAESGLEIECERELTYDDPPIRCFVDGIIKYHWKGKDVVVEIKTTRAEAFAYLAAKNEAREYQKMQLLIYMHIMGERYGAILYENKNDHKKLLIPVEMTAENKVKVEKAFAWMRMVRANWEEQQLPVRPYRKNSRICAGCPIKTACFAESDGIIELPILDYTIEGKG